ncbi:thermonuclease family protein [Hwanghaeella grinnelliae]|uniref:Thermonuclease family protein n=1 Tax=Hwanghaeella grinnelliae TaxID=2500179 RepID=A0A3S3UQ69_9PROT|nr:thermonuclease family protein [Hwanghaeella grinnelliae]RVU37967.1 thermonuclease family protein [Hwanghaeella grinnelliae]
MRFWPHSAAERPNDLGWLAGICLLLSVFASFPAVATGTLDKSFSPRTVQIKVTQVRSGDEFTSGRFKVRLYGIASPDFGTPLGSDAVGFLNRLIWNQQISCRLTGQGFKDAEVGTCRIGGKDIAEALVREGLALPCHRLGGRLYERAAQRAKDTGIADQFDLPAYCGSPQGSEM